MQDLIKQSQNKDLENGLLRRNIQVLYDISGGANSSSEVIIKGIMRDQMEEIMQLKIIQNAN